MEAKYMAMSLATQHLVWLQCGLQQLRQHITYSVATDKHEVDYLLGDNQGVLELAKNHRINNRSKHIDTHYHHVCKRLEAGTFDLMYVPTEDNVADLFTKNLPKPRHHELVEKIHCA